jgi:hypothetical protein
MSYYDGFKERKGKMWDEIKGVGNSLLRDLGINMPHPLKVTIEIIVVAVLLGMFLVTTYKILVPAIRKIIEKLKSNDFKKQEPALNGLFYAGKWENSYTLPGKPTVKEHFDVVPNNIYRVNGKKRFYLVNFSFNPCMNMLAFEKKWINNKFNNIKVELEISEQDYYGGNEKRFFYGKEYCEGLKVDVIYKKIGS